MPAMQQSPVLQKQVMIPSAADCCIGACKRLKHCWIRRERFMHKSILFSLFLHCSGANMPAMLQSAALQV